MFIARILILSQINITSSSWVVFQAEEFKLHYFDVTKYGLYVEDEDFWEFDLTSGLSGKGEEKTTGVNGYSREWATAGFFGRLNYDFMGRYLLEVNMRYDGTSVSAAAVAGNYPLFLGRLEYCTREVLRSGYQCC